MAVRLKTDGTYEFDSVQEAVEFNRLSSQAAASAKDTEQVKAKRGRESVPSRMLVESYIRSLPEHQLKIITAICESPGCTTEEVAAKVHNKASQIGPILRHMRSRAVREGLTTDPIVRTEKIASGAGERAESHYYVSEAVIAAVASMK